MLMCLFLFGLPPTQTHQTCDECDAVFDDPHYAFGMRQKHRILAHGSKEGTNPLPNA